MRAVIAGLCAIMFAGPALAAEDNACVAASEFVQAEFALPEVAAALKHKHLNVVVVGSASSTLPGAEGPAKAYPARLAEAFKRRISGLDVKVIPHTRTRDTAVEMAKALPQILADDRPNLLIWQTGTADAMLGIDPDEFQSALDAGLEQVHAAKADAVLVNMQYSPRTDSMIALGSYLDAMRYVALQREVPLFDRLAVMKNWNEAGIFDLYATTKGIDVAEQVHDCIGRLLARLIIDGANLAKIGNTGSASPAPPDKDVH